MKDLSNTPVYVDSVNGSDSNSGFSAAESVKTIGKALEIGNTLCKTILYITGGENYVYDGPVIINNYQICDFQIHGGNITINGQVYISYSTVRFAPDSANTKITINGNLNIANQSVFNCSCDLDIYENNNSPTLTISNNAIVVFWNDVNLYGSSSQDVIAKITFLSSVFFYQSINLYPVSCNIALLINEKSKLVSLTSPDSYLRVYSTNGKCNYAIQVDLDSDLITSRLIANNVSELVALVVYSHSHVTIGAECVLTTISSDTVSGDRIPVVIESGSSLIIRGGNSTISAAKGAKNTLMIRHDSLFVFYGSTLRLYLYTGESLINCYSSKFFQISGTLDVAGTSTNGVVRAGSDSMITIMPGVTTSTSSSISGKRYVAAIDSLIDTFGGGPNRIPGSVAGTVDASSLYN